jgi:hypothetical protein
MNSKLRLLREINDDEEFFRGTVLRKYNVGMNDDVISNKENFYDYILARLPWENDMVMINVTKNSSKFGAGYTGSIPVNTSNGNFSVNKKGFQHTLGEDLLDWFLIEQDH